MPAPSNAWPQRLLGPDVLAPADRQLLRWRSTLGLALALGLVTAWALPRHIQAGDAGELATIMLRGGVPHPSGYPWMRLLGWVVARPLESLGLPPATAAALPCAMAAVLGWAVLHRVALRLAFATVGHRRPAVAIATIVIGIVALSPMVVVHTADSEVWGPIVLATAVLAWLVLIRRPPPFVLGLAIGLATSHHLTAVLLVPLVVGGAWPQRARPAAVLRAGALGLAGSAVGLLPYLGLMIAPSLGPCTPHGAGGWWWGDTTSWAGLVHHVSRADYGVFSLSLHAEQPPVFAQWARVASSLGSALTAGLVSVPWGASALLVLVLVVAGLRPPAAVRRSVWIGTLATIVVVVVFFPIAHNIDPTSPFGAWILERFDLMGIVLLVLPVVTAVGTLVRATARPLIRRALATVGLVLLLRQAVLLVSHGSPRRNDTIERHALDLLRTPEPDRLAIVFGTDDHRLFPVLFAQEVLGVGANVLYVDASLLAHAWYRERLEQIVRCRPEHEGRPPLPTEDKPLRMMAALWDDPAWRETPLYITHAFSRPAAGLPRVPEGLLWRVLPPDVDAEPERFDADRVLQRHLAALSRYPPPLPDPQRAGNDPFAVDLAATYTEPTAQLATVLTSQGRTEDAGALLRAFAERSQVSGGSADPPQ